LFTTSSTATIYFFSGYTPTGLRGWRGGVGEGGKKGGGEKNDGGLRFSRDSFPPSYHSLSLPCCPKGRRGGEKKEKKGGGKKKNHKVEYGNLHRGLPHFAPMLQPLSCTATAVKGRRRKKEEKGEGRREREERKGSKRGLADYINTRDTIPIFPFAVSGRNEKKEEKKKGKKKKKKGGEEKKGRKKKPVISAMPYVQSAFPLFFSYLSFGRQA